MNNFMYTGLDSLVSYTTMDKKTRHQLYVSTLNCDIDTVVEEMNLVKKSMEKQRVFLHFMDTNHLLQKK